MVDPKRLVVLSAFLLVTLIPSKVEAQVAVGLSGGAAFSKITSDDIDDDSFDRRTGLVLGGFASFPLSEMVGLTTGLYYLQRGAEDAEAGSDIQLKLDYLTVPVLLQVDFAPEAATSFSVFAGPALAFEVGCEIEGSGGGASASVDCDASALGGEGIETKSVSLDGVVGAGVRFSTSETMFLFGNGGLSFGLTSIDDSEDGDAKNQSWFVQAGIGWIVGG
jgi:hypothetical protein